MSRTLTFLAEYSSWLTTIDILHHLYVIFQAFQVAIENIIVILRFMSMWAMENM